MTGPGPLPTDIAGLWRRSSFGPAFWLMPAERRRGMQVLYAFCRAVDDAADEAASPREGRALLRAWQAVLAGRRAPASPLERETLWLCRRWGVPRAVLAEIVEGALSDLRPKVRFATRAQADLYCHRVAGAVGLACLPLFGADLEAGRGFAEALGLGFQLTNILRDVREDAGRGRLYFSAQDLRRHGAREADLLACRSTPACQALFADTAARAQAKLNEAWRLAEGLQGADLRPARAMAAVYGGLLAAMRADGLRVMEKRYRLGTLRKAWAVLSNVL